MARSNTPSLANVWAGAPAGLSRGGRATTLRTCRRASTGSRGLAFLSPSSSSPSSSPGRRSWRRRSSSEVTSVTDAYTLPYPAPPPPRELSVPALEALAAGANGPPPPIVVAPAVNVHALVAALSVGDEVRDAAGALSLRGGGGGSAASATARRLGVDGMGGAGLRNIPHSDKLGLFVSLCSLLVSVQVLMPQIL